MAAFGLSDTGQNARGRLGEIPNWFYEWMRQNTARSNAATDTGEGLNNQYLALINSMLGRDNPFGSPYDAND